MDKCRKNITTKEMTIFNRTNSDVTQKPETESMRGIWKGMLTEKEIQEGIKEIRSKWRIDTP